jgi:hypothetical protein
VAKVCAVVRATVPTEAVGMNDEELGASALESKL